MPQREVHGRVLDFVFADGLLAYDCVSCGAKCCKHGDFYVDLATELEPLRRIAPNLAPFLSSAASARTLLGTSHHPGCWFLDDDNRCALQARGAKPYNCQLFPVNQLTVLAGRVYVDVALSCPLGLRGREGRSGTLITHDSVAELVARHPGAGGPRARGLPAGYDGLNRDVEALLSRLRQHAGGWREEIPWATAYVELREGVGLPIAGAEVEGRLRALRALFATDGRLTDPARRLLDEALMALTPSLLVHGQWSRVSRLDGREALLGWLAERLDALLGVRYLCEVGAALGERPFGTGAVASLFRDSHALARTLGLAHRPVKRSTAGPPLALPTHLEAAGRELCARIERGEASVLDHLRAMGVGPFEARGLLEVITHNLAP
jgi:hypothetical protein